MFTLCFLETAKTRQETSAEETGAGVQQRAVELTPAADGGAVRFGEVGRVFTGTWLEKQSGQTVFLVRTWLF